MVNRIQVLTRPGNLALSMVAFSGLTLLAAFMWNVAPGYVILLLIPALAISFYQMVLSPVNGLRMDDAALTVLSDTGVTSVPLDRIAEIRLTGQPGAAQGNILLGDGAVMAIPFEMGADHCAFLRRMADRGIPVREG